MLSTLGRAGKVLDLFTVDTPEWGATAVAHELKIAKSQAHELLVSLAVAGLLQRVGMGRYRLGWRIVALNAVLVETSDLLRLVAPEMRALVGRYGETVHVAVWDERPVCIDARSGRLSTSIPPFRVGADLPACSTALGKVLLAGRPRNEIDAVPVRRGTTWRPASVRWQPRDSPTRSRSTSRAPARSPRRSSTGTRASSRRSACRCPWTAGGAAGRAIGAPWSRWPRTSHAAAVACGAPEGGARRYEKFRIAERPLTGIWVSWD